MSNISNKLRLIQGRELPIIQQAEGAECGIACLGMVAGFFGHRMDMPVLRSKFTVSLEGCTLRDLMKFAQRLEMSSRPLRAELDDLKKFRKPVILHWDLNHFVVLKKVRGKRYIIHDPAHGCRSLTRDQMSENFTGVMLELTPTKEFKHRDVRMKLSFSDFWTRIVGLKRSLGLLFLLSILLQIFILAAPYYQQLVIDEVLLSRDFNMLSVLAVGFGMILLFEIATNVLRSLTLLHFGGIISIQLTSNLFHHLVRLPVTYFEKRHIGDVVERFRSLDEVKRLLTEGMVEALIDGLIVIGVLVMLYIYSALLATIVLAGVLIYAGIRFGMYRALRKASMQEIIAKAGENSNFMETVRGIQTIKILGGEAHREGLWQNHFVNSVNRRIKVGLFQISFQNANRFLFGLETIIVIYLAARLIMGGQFSVGMLMAFLAYKRQFTSKASRLVEMLVQFKMLNLHFERLADVALTPREVTEPDNTRDNDLQGGVGLHNASFRYSDNGPWIVRDLSLNISTGESVALVGPSGCGKTTVMKLMLGLLPPNEGKVLVDGIRLEHIGLRRYREQVAAVMQEDQLLSGSIRENITFYESQPNMDKVVACASRAAIHDDISRMPMGYNSLIGDMGSSLSGGQKQRLLLARALYRRPRILFLDEATSHVDARTEHEINDAIREMNITRVIIAHRRETIDSADRVIDLGLKLDEGKWTPETRRME